MNYPKYYIEYDRELGTRYIAEDAGNGDPVNFISPETAVGLLNANVAVIQHMQRDIRDIYDSCSADGITPIDIAEWMENRMSWLK